MERACLLWSWTCDSARCVRMVGRLSAVELRKMERVTRRKRKARIVGKTIVAELCHDNNLVVSLTVRVYEYYVSLVI